jgi:hypothetical protein
MSFSFAQLKGSVRAAVHDTFAVSARYRDETLIEPVQMRVRLHTRNRPLVDSDVPEGYAVMVEQSDRVVFAKDELAALGVTPIRGAELVFTDYGVTVFLDRRDPDTGPVEEVWIVTR